MPTVETHLSPSLIRIEPRQPSPHAVTIDVAALEKELRAGIRGEVRFSEGDRGMYASDAGNYRMAPIGVVLPAGADDVLHTLAVCRAHGAPIVARGGGTGIPGQTVNIAVLLDFSKYMNRIVELNPQQR